MDERLREAAFRLTVVLVAAGFALVGAGWAGLGGSLVLVAAMLALAGACYALASAAADTGLDRRDARGVVSAVPGGPLVAAVVGLGFLGATPGELQALGGLLGLAGMANYFLRPVYQLLYGLVARVRAA